MARGVADDLGRLRRDLKNVAPEVGKQLDRELKVVGADVARRASANSRRRTGKFARNWKVSLTNKRGVSVRNNAPQAQQQERGAKIWIRRGRPYRAPAGYRGPVAARGRRGQVRLRQRPAGPGMVVNEAQILIERSAPGARAVEQELPRSRARIANASRAAAIRALR